VQTELGIAIDDTPRLVFEDNVERWKGSRE
jgi:hypothetical protein